MGGACHDCEGRGSIVCPDCRGACEYEGEVCTSGLSRSYRYQAGILFRMSEYFH